MGIFTTLKNMAVRDKATTSVAYRRLVLIAAEDKPHNKETAVETIEAAGKTFDEFSADVELMTQRLADAATLKECAETRVDFEAANKRLDALDEQRGEEIQAIRDKYRKIHEKENLKQRVDDKRMRDADSRKRAARQRLLATADPAIEAEIDVVIQKVRKHDQRTKSLCDKKDRWRGIIGTLRDESRETRDARQRKDANRQIKNLEQALPKLQDEIQLAVVEEAKALQDELTAVSEKKLDPQAMLWDGKDAQDVPNPADERRRETERRIKNLETSLYENDEEQDAPSSDAPSSDAAPSAEKSKAWWDSEEQGAPSSDAPTSPAADSVKKPNS